ncbi:alpha/beta hydrolase [Alkalihalophilus lindianensis]|uniref:Alpha/beta hydrolase n=1 Tax=Alkalihalophilus lindianensis TaxID=1630542 RepID=A0ABU3X740_9BACI|nr:alpha/beta hydrolase [Alkalihalophilus lindianensis]MDV2683710.1 alpha/beta hydrolase [Alkalihalophilus lindianensis]
MSLRKHWWKWLIGIMILLASILYSYLQPYQASNEANEKRISTEQVLIEDTPNWISFSPTNSIIATIIFYPGGLVEPESYSPLTHSLAEENIRSYIVKMPVNLAVLGGNRASKLVNEIGSEPVFIGGHSLGGVMASRFAAENEDIVDGVFFLASYPDKKGSLDTSSLPSLSITASNDEVLNQEAYMNAKSFWGDNHTEIMIEGGNHAQFGSYGEQGGDGMATISTDDQMTEVHTILLQWIDEIAGE